MREARLAVRNRIIADTRIATVGAGSSTTVVQVGVGEAASWAKGDIASFTGTGATLANDKLIRTITGVDTSLHRLTLESALPVAPASGNQVRGGCREWLIDSLAGGDGVFEWGHDPHPLQALIALETEKRCICMMNGFAATPGPLGRIEPAGQLDLYGLDGLWLEGLETRIRQILHDRQSALTASGHKVWSVKVASLPEVFRGDVRQRTAFVDLSLTRAA